MRLLILILFALMVSCQQEHSYDTENRNSVNYNEELIKANQHLIKSEDEDIADFLKRYQWKMQKTGSGLRYMIYHQGKGIPSKMNATAKINYQVSLINGILCYSSKDKGPMEFVIGRSTVESGLQEGILLLKVGDKAKFIIPSHLAYGLLGDQNKIPKRATLVYDVELLEIKENN